MKITPLDIRRKEFKRSVRGYSDEEVDIFLDEVADEFERIFQENMELQDRAQRMDEQISGHAQLKDALEKTLISAQLQSEEIRANAHKESELILRDAEMKARGIVSESYSETQRTQQALVQLKMLEEDFRFKFRALLEGYLRLLSEAPLTVTGSDVPPAKAATPAETAAPASAPVAPQPARVAPEPASAVPQPVPMASQPAPMTPQPAYVAPEPPAAAAAAPVAATAAPIGDPARYVRPSDEDVPTEESMLPVADPDVVARGFALPEFEQGITAEIAVPAAADTPSGQIGPAVDDTADTEPVRGFFFGRQMDDMDDTFPGEDAGKKDRTRDFEW